MQASADNSLEYRYDRRVADGQIVSDDAQREVLKALQALSSQLASESGLVARFIRKRKALPGLYIWGNVGRGKSMLMDLFFGHVAVKARRRVHFHAFMQEVHARIHQLRQASQYQGDVVAALAADIAGHTRLLCFDELQATDPANASLLHRLFSGLFEHGVVIVSTSNHPPASLYTGGVQRERFAKFIALIQQEMQVLALSSPSDYRLKQRQSLEKRYFYPLGAEADSFIDNVLAHLVTDQTPHQDQMVVQGRTTHFTLYDGDTGRFTFRELCSQNLGPADYLTLAKRLDALILTDIPVLTPEQRNEAKRFVTLIDTLYEYKVKLVATAQTAPEGIYTDGDGHFEFARTVSRLAEMQSENYWKDA